MNIRMEQTSYKILRTIFRDCWTCSHPEYSWNTTHWTLSNLFPDILWDYLPFLDSATIYCLLFVFWCGDIIYRISRTLFRSGNNYLCSEEQSLDHLIWQKRSRKKKKELNWWTHQGKQLESKWGTHQWKTTTKGRRTIT
jgi:hypothetical protein